MNAVTLVKPQIRVKYTPVNKFNIIGYGENNLYPQLISDIVACSESGTTCLNRYISFIQGNGFNDTDFSNIVVNSDGQTVDDILDAISHDLGCYGGFAIHINYNSEGGTVSIYNVPFEHCRLEYPDEDGNINRIAVCSFWQGKQTKTGYKYPTINDIDFIDRYDPDKFMFDDKDEHFEDYKGQILWFSNSGKNEYPKSIFDCVVTQMSIEEGLGNIAYRNARNGLFPAKAIAVRRGQDTVSTSNNNNETDDEILNASNSNQSIVQALVQAQTDMNSSSIVVITVAEDEEIVQTIDLAGENYDKAFTVSTDVACEKIYAAFGQEVWHRLRKGGLGFSGDIMKNAYDVYSSTTGTERRSISRVFKTLFANWFEPITDSKIFEIQPLVYVTEQQIIKDETINND